jgi:hypothetical protein
MMRLMSGICGSSIYSNLTFPNGSQGRAFCRLGGFLHAPRMAPHLHSNPLDDYGGCHAAAGTHGRQTSLEVAALEFIQQCSDQDGTGGADGVT